MSNDPNRITALDKLVDLAVWGRGQRYFKACDAARRMGVSQRTVYRYLAALMAIDDRLSGEAGVGYHYRNRRKDTDMADYNRDLLREVAASNDTGIAEDSLAGVTRVELVAGEIAKHKEIFGADNAPAEPDGASVSRALARVNDRLAELTFATQENH